LATHKALCQAEVFWEEEYDIVVQLMANCPLRDANDIKKSIKKIKESNCKAAECLGIQSVSFGKFPDNRLDTVDLLDIVKVVEGAIAQYQPDTVLTHHVGDVNIDHQRVHQAVVTACHPQKGHPVRTLLFFEVPSSTEWQPPGSAAAFLPNWFIDISDTLERKLEALSTYSEELRDFPHPRSHEAVEALARWRGATVGSRAAEGFVLGRRID
jgi:LmbE family N-acetylglucosaminyl deacetylase